MAVEKDFRTVLPHGAKRSMSLDTSPRRCWPEATIIRRNYRFDDRYSKGMGDAARGTRAATRDGTPWGCSRGAANAPGVYGSASEISASGSQAAGGLPDRPAELQQLRCLSLANWR